MSNMWNPNTAVRAQRLRLVESPVPPVDRDPFAEGYAAAQLSAAAEFAAERALLTHLIDAAMAIKPVAAEPLAALLAETVLRLVENVVGSAPVDAGLLNERALALAAAIHGPEGPVTLHVHPSCVVLLDGVRSNVEIMGDAAIEPGQIVMSNGARAAEDGVASALERVRVALAAIL